MPSFARSLFTVSGLTIVSRVGGFVRDTLTAMFLGAGPLADAYFVAQRLPNLFRSLFAEGAFSAAFVPLYTKEDEQQGPAAAKSFAAEALAVLLAILIPFSILLVLFMPQVIMVLAPGFHDEPEKFTKAVAFSRITFPYLLFISVTALQGGVLNANNIFGPAAAAPIALNIVLIAALFLAEAAGWEIAGTLSWAMAFGGIVQMAWLMVSCHRAGLGIRLVRPRFTPRIVRLFKQIGPGAIGSGATQINLMISTVLASFLPTGAVSYLYYADRLNQLPLGIVGIAVATTLLPVLSRFVAANDEEKVRHYTSRAIEFCLLLGLPAMMGLAVAAAPIIRTLFQYGAFGPEDTAQTAKALMAYSLCIPAFLLVKVFSASFFAHHDTKTPVKIALIAMLANLAGALGLLPLLGHTGIALAASLASWVNVALLLRALRRQRSGPLVDAQMMKRLPRFLISAGGMGLTSFALTYILEGSFGGSLGLRIGSLTVMIGLSCLAYALLLQLTGAMRWREALAILKRQ